jgi:putative colanic acid biosynthesis UDP-glucose lipid carrier transferase
MGQKTGRYSGYIRPILYVIDLTIVLTMASLFLNLEGYFIAFALLIPFGWVIAAIKVGFYEV